MLFIQHYHNKPSTSIDLFLAKERASDSHGAVYLVEPTANCRVHFST